MAQGEGEEAPLSLQVQGCPLRVTHPGRLLWPEPPISKAAYLAYLTQVAPLMLPWLRGRPLAVIRCPDGIPSPGFYQRRWPSGAPAWVRGAQARAARGEGILLCEDLPTLLWLGSQAAVAFHPANARAEAPDRPDWAVIDLDPQPPLGLEAALELALDLRDVLAALGLPAFPKLSGGRGLHVFVPLQPRYSAHAVQCFVQALGQLACRRWPGRVTLERARGRRGPRIYLDYLQNGPGRTMVALFSPRPLPGAPVSFPLSWEQVRTLAERPARSAAYTVATVPALLRCGEGRAWAGFWEARATLPPQTA